MFCLRSRIVANAEIGVHVKIELPLDGENSLASGADLFIVQFTYRNSPQTTRVPRSVRRTRTRQCAAKLIIARPRVNKSKCLSRSGLDRVKPCLLATGSGGNGLRETWFFLFRRPLRRFHRSGCGQLPRRASQRSCHHRFCRCGPLSRLHPRPHQLCPHPTRLRF